VAKTPEAKVKDAIRAELKAAGEDLWFFMPIGGMFSIPGIPDFVGLRRGRFFAIEAKSATGRPTKMQLDVHELIRKAGGVVEIIKPGDVPIQQQVQDLLSKL